MKTAKLLIALALLTQTTPVLAWGKIGHRVTCAIADHYLSRAARHQVRRILGVETLAEASNWPDFMRASTDPFWQKTASPWHYVTVPDGKSYADVGAPPEGDALTALKRFAAALRDPATPRAEKQLALRFMVHIIGDVHQPLHVGNGTDHGGNDVKLTFFNAPTNLHAVWDSGIIDQEQLSYSEYAAWLTPRITRQKLRQWWTADPRVWIAESQALRGGVYPKGTAISYDYVFVHKATVEQRLEQAGVRIAAYLNALFAPRAMRGRSLLRRG